jgi:hypothetical protein
MPSPVTALPKCGCGHTSGDHDPWPVCTECDCLMFHEKDKK